MKTKELIKAMEVFNRKYAKEVEQGNPNACIMALGYLECFEVFAREQHDEVLLDMLADLQVNVALKWLGGIFNA